MRFTSPELFWLIFLLIPMAWRILSTEHYLNRLRHRFRATVNGNPRWRRAARCLLPLLGLASLITALAGPEITVMRAGSISENLVLAVGIDVSKSMLAEDVVLKQPSVNTTSPLSNRLNAARQCVLALLKRLDGEKVGLFFFARNGIEVVSPTRDLGFVRYMATHTALGDLTESGSNLLAAIDSGLMMVDSQPGLPAKAVILITDGEDTENTRSEIMQGLSQGSGHQTPVYTVGVGSPREVFIPIRRKGSTEIDGFYLDSHDIPLKTRHDPQTLQEIAVATGGSYLNLGNRQPEHIATRLLKNITSTTASPVDLPARPTSLDLAPIFLLLSLIFYIPFLLL